MTDADVADALARGWGVVAEEISYAPIGFGSHHWTVRSERVRWFLTVDDLDGIKRDEADTRSRALERLTAALVTSRILQENGRPFVVAPKPTTSGTILQAIDDRFVLALYPHVQGETSEFGSYASQSERVAVVDRLVEIHGAVAEVEAVIRTDDFLIPSRAELERAIEATSSRWNTGPFAERSRILLEQHGEATAAALTRYDVLADSVSADHDRFVVTHGEPHRGNTIVTTDGVALVDWDTALLAPPERDLWSLIDEDATIAAVYASRSGRAVLDEAIQMYRLWWNLCEISLYIAGFRAPHQDTADTRTAWLGLETHLDPARWRNS